MRNKWLKRILVAIGSVVFLLVITLVVHLYVVKASKAPDANTRIMARMDFGQDINAEDADKITTWLYQQKGIDHVLCNAATDIAVFSFYPVQTSADKVINDFKQNFDYKAERFLPSQDDLKKGCPVAVN